MNETRKDYGPQGRAEQGVKMLGIFTFISLAIFKARKIRRSRS